MGFCFSGAYTVSAASVCSVSLQAPSSFLPLTFHRWASQQELTAACEHWVLNYRCRSTFASTSCFPASLSLISVRHFFVYFVIFSWHGVKLHVYVCVWQFESLQTHTAELCTVLSRLFLCSFNGDDSMEPTKFKAWLIITVCQAHTHALSLLPAFSKRPSETWYRTGLSPTLWKSSTAKA